MARKQYFAGRPDFPNEEPQKILAGATTNDTDEVYCIDTLGQDVTLASGMKAIADDGTKSASSWASTQINGVIYGRWTNVGGTDGTLACYVVDVANSES